MKNINKARSILKNKLRNRERVFAAWTSLANPSITEIFCRMGVDFVGIDIEHSTISQEQSQRIIAASQANGALCLPRIASHNVEMARRLLDSGADGLIVPMVSTPEQVEDIIDWVKYPTEGKRGFGVSRAQGYGFDFSTYAEEWNKVSSLIIQIESVEGVGNIDKMLAYDAIDAAMVGPYDLSASLGIPGQIDHPKVAEAAEYIIKACQKHGKACGTQIVDPDLEKVEKAFSAGYTFIVLSSDIFLLWKWGEKMNKLTKEAKASSCEIAK